MNVILQKETKKLKQLTYRKVKAERGKRAWEVQVEHFFIVFHIPLVNAYYILKIK